MEKLDCTDAFASYWQTLFFSGKMGADRSFLNTQSSNGSYGRCRLCLEPAVSILPNSSMMASGLTPREVVEIALIFLPSGYGALRLTSSDWVVYSSHAWGVRFRHARVGLVVRQTLTTLCRYYDSWYSSTGKSMEGTFGMGNDC
jgi:hypothetical protein